MIKSKRTKNCILIRNIFSFLHFICLFGPLLYFIPYAYITSETVAKIGLSFTLIVSIILAAISAIVGAKEKAGLHRCIMWALIAGVLFGLNQVKTFIWLMAITSILDELIFVKVRDYYKAMVISNKEIDRRV